MNEKYSFETTNESFDHLALEESEIETLRKLGLETEDLDKLLKTEPFDEGSYALLFNLPEQQSQRVAKVWKDPENASDRAQSENTALRLLRRRQYDNAPEISGFVKSATILFEEKIDGKAIEEFDPKAIEQLALAMSSLHSIELNSFGRLGSDRTEGTQLDYLREGLDDLRERSSLLENDSEQVRDTIGVAIEKMEETAASTEGAFSKTTFTLIHFDINKKNLLQTRDGEKMVLIDWEQAAAGDNAMDIAKMFFKLNFTDEQQELFLEDYERKLPKPDTSLRDRIYVYKQYVVVNSILWRYSVLKGSGREEVSDRGEKFYDQVKEKLEPEIDALREFIKS